MNTLKRISKGTLCKRLPHATAWGWFAFAFLLFTEWLLVYYTLIAEGTGL